MQEAASLFDAIGNAPWEARCLRHLARLFEMRGDLNAACAFTAHAIELLTPEPWAPSERIPYLLDLAHLESRKDKRDNAVAYVREAKSLASRGEHEELLADCCLAEASFLRGESAKAQRAELLEAATQHLQAALAHCEIRGRRAVFMERLASIHASGENIHQARIWFEKALHEFEAIGDVSGVARCMGALAGAARFANAPDEALASLERVLEVTKGLPLYRERAAALHDVARMRLAYRGDVAAARRCLTEAEALANEYGLRDLRDPLKELAELVDHAERVNRPGDRDLAAVITELHRWCARFPESRDAILPLWYYMHRTNLWAIARSMLGVKFLIRSEDPGTFQRVASKLFSQGDLFIFGLTFTLRKQRRTELIPCDEELLFPSHMSFAFIKKEGDGEEGEPDPAAVARAYTKALRSEAYLGVPFSEPVDGVRMHVLGRHLRLPGSVGEIMFDESVITKKWICLPLGGGMTPLDDDMGDEAPDLHHVLLAAWENGFMPLFLDTLPNHGEVNVLASTPITLCGLAGESNAAAKDEWATFLSECIGKPRQALAHFRDYWSTTSASIGDSDSIIRGTAYALRFLAGANEITYPAVVLKL